MKTFFDRFYISSWQKKSVSAYGSLQISSIMHDIVYFKRRTVTRNEVVVICQAECLYKTVFCSIFSKNVKREILGKNAQLFHAMYPF